VLIKLTATTEEKRWGEKKEKTSKGNYIKSQNEINKYFSRVSAVSILSLSGSHSPPHFPRIPSNTALVSRPAVGAAQILIWSYSCVFLPSRFLCQWDSPGKNTGVCWPILVAIPF